MKIRAWLSSYSRQFPVSLVYMLQSSEYSISEYLGWLHRAENFRTVQKRKRLDYTIKAKFLLALAWGIVALLILMWTLAIILLQPQPIGVILSAIVVVLLLPFALPYLLIVPLWLGQIVIQRPQERAIIRAARAKIRTLPATTIAIAGSYGKTTMRDILVTVISAGKKTATPIKNYNVPISVGRFINGLDADEEVIVVELGEYYPGDVADLTDLVDPDIGVITGINEAHLSKFKTLENTAKTIFELADYLDGKPLFVNAENKLVQTQAKQYKTMPYSTKGCDGWHISNPKTSLEGTEFIARKDGKEIRAHSELLGLHQVGPLACAIALADSLGLTGQQIEHGIAQIKAYEHRMQPRQSNGAWIIDDTYNGNIDGMRVGLKFLGGLSAKRKIYVTPGIVEHGHESPAVHQRLGQYIAQARPDLVVLMQNSALADIQSGLESADFAGQIRIETDPERFYHNIDQFVASGDVVLMQNDWSDAYA